MKPLIITLSIILAGLNGMGQGKTKPKYYQTTVEYMASDKCMHGNTMTEEVFNGSPDFDDIYKAISDYIKPYKIIRKTFKIVEMIRSTEYNFKHSHAAKFKPCCKAPVKFTAVVADSLKSDLVFNIFSRNIIEGHVDYPKQVKHAYIVIVKDTSSMSLQYTDSLFTLHISPKFVTKINDSTFTFKQLK